MVAFTSPALVSGSTVYLPSGGEVPVADTLGAGGPLDWGLAKSCSAPASTDSVVESPGTWPALCSGAL